jgi:uncharacterized protein (DUF2267 family)
MSATGLEVFDHTLQLTHEWINDLDAQLGWNDKKRSYRLLKAVLHALRDWLPVNEAAAVAAQLPELLRGAYYEHWRPAATPVKNRSKRDFIGRVDESFHRDPLPEPIPAVMAVFELLSRRISAGEIDNVRHALPSDIRTIWPEAYVEPAAIRR